MTKAESGQFAAAFEHPDRKAAQKAVALTADHSHQMKKRRCRSVGDRGDLSELHLSCKHNTYVDP